LLEKPKNFLTDQKQFLLSVKNYKNHKITTKHDTKMKFLTDQNNLVPLIS
jgi:hypothetical protein